MISPGAKSGQKIQFYENIIIDYQLIKGRGKGRLNPVPATIEKINRNIRLLFSFYNA